MSHVKKINLTKPSIDKKEIKAAADVLKSGWLIRGKQTQALEEEFAKFMGAKYAIATNGCTMALYLVLKRMGIGPGDEVIVPSLTWSATASVVVNVGAIPVFADVRKDDWCLDPVDVKRKITKRTKLVIPVHFAARFAKGFSASAKSYGGSADSASVATSAKGAALRIGGANFPVPVLYDSAHRIEKKDFKGTVSCYSFYAVKNMTTVRGGMILTNNKEDAKWYMMAVHGGIAKDTLSRYKGANEQNDASSFYYEVEWPGWNFDMTDVEAAIGRVQLKKLPKLNARRNKIVKQYNRALGLKNTGNHLYPILVKNRDQFLVNLKAAGIHCGVHYLPLHQMKAYKKYPAKDLKNTEFIGEHCVSLPLYADLSDAEVEYVIKQVKLSGGLL